MLNSPSNTWSLMSEPNKLTLSCFLWLPSCLAWPREEDEECHSIPFCWKWSFEWNFVLSRKFSKSQSQISPLSCLQSFESNQGLRNFSGFWCWRTMKWSNLPSQMAATKLLLPRISSHDTLISRGASCFSIKCFVFDANCFDNSLKIHLEHGPSRWRSPAWVVQKKI